MTRILIAESNFEEKLKLEAMFKDDARFEVVAATDDGEDALEKLKETKPCVVVCNFAMKKMCGISFCEFVKENAPEISVIMFSSAFSDKAIKRMVDVGVDHYMIKPFEANSLKKQILFLKGEVEPKTKAAKVMKEFPPISNKKLDDKLSKLFIEIGIPAHIKGYSYLREGVKLIVSDNSMINAITKQLYPTIARIFNTTSSKVERAIRHAIEVGWNRGRLHKINEIFNVSAFSQNDKPTNGEFIGFIADKLLLEGYGDAS
ncbi:MAG: sporulation transcription factor Spo0A [Firmicutes bacterium]|nr:sporulation transcription factor Spo0A [Bacillota bacterium]